MLRRRIGQTIHTTLRKDTAKNQSNQLKHVLYYDNVFNLIFNTVRICSVVVVEGLPTRYKTIDRIIPDTHRSAISKRHVITLLYLLKKRKSAIFIFIKINGARYKQNVHHLSYLKRNTQTKQ
jgi:hypothetical protein